MNAKDSRQISSHLISHCTQVVNTVASSASNNELSSFVVRLGGFHLKI